jgi:phytoene dehydrogenase-like protein
MRYDVIVVGGGPNGLAAAARLAGAGRKVIVLERRGELGGLSAPIEFHPGYRAPGILFDDGLVSPPVAARLGLAAHGLAFAEPAPVYLAEEGGPGILLDRDPARAASELSPPDAAAYAAVRAFFARLAPLVERLMSSPPPPLSPATLADYREVVRLGLAVWKLDRAETLELARVAPMCVADFLNERFASPLLVEGLAAPAVTGTWAGPWSAGTATNLILREAAPGRPVAGGPPALVVALERAALAAGAEVRTAAEVVRIRLDDGRAAGVELAGGESIDAAHVVATSDPKRALLDLVEPGALPIGSEDEFRRIRMRGTAAKIHLALSAPLELAARPGEAFAAIRVGGGHVDALERAFDAVKYRQLSPQPHLEIRVPTVHDASLAPPGHHVVSILASYAPIDLAGGWDERRNGELLAAVLARLAPLAPTLAGRLVATQVLSPADLEREYALTGGQLHHGEPALDQLFVLRPTSSAARYATAVPGLWLGGSGSHGGGGVNAAPGLLAAEALLAAKRGR